MDHSTRIVPSYQPLSNLANALKLSCRFIPFLRGALLDFELLMMDLSSLSACALLLNLNCVLLKLTWLLSPYLLMVISNSKIASLHDCPLVPCLFGLEQTTNVKLVPASFLYWDWCVFISRSWIIVLVDGLFDTFKHVSAERSWYVLTSSCFCVQ